MVILNSILKFSIIWYCIYKSYLKSSINEWFKSSFWNLVLFNFNGFKNYLYLKLISNNLLWSLINKLLKSKSKRYRRDFRIQQLKLHLDFSYSLITKHLQLLSNYWLNNILIDLNWSNKRIKESFLTFMITYIPLTQNTRVDSLVFEFNCLISST